jgi:hypothetical protein
MGNETMKNKVIYGGLLHNGMKIGIKKEELFS